ncbi:hypothetical protein TcasGA2_TC016103 [Tribolium castaneum]|uniref:Reverse transcriptase domain-containing protein n=1 Tax=Tribolium castaneum TaxID=7070 RepID=D7ELQ6_TRICA|nr:hypothetical protein TcasGA2_TC016103 [Tribolium castaneum]
MEINSFQDSEILQECLKTLNIWCDKNRLQLNLAKCCVVSFTKKQNIINYPYEISNSVLNRVITVKDLGITFDAEFSFNFHVREIVDKALKSYGFIYKNGNSGKREFTNIKILRILYFAFVRSRLEYGALIWNPIYNTYVVQLENVQRRFLKYLAFLSDGVYPIQENDVKWTRSKSKAVKVVCTACNNNITQFKDLNALINAHHTQFTEAIKNLKQELEAQINELKNGPNYNVKLDSTNFEKVLQEVSEREKRKRNIIVYGVSEPPKEVTNKDQRIIQDKDFISTLLHTIKPNLQTDKIQVHRLGRYSGEGVRPRAVKVVLNNENEVKAVVFNAKELKNHANYRNISLSMDKTPRQIAYYKQLQQELNDRTSKGESNLKIK